MNVASASFVRRWINGAISEPVIEYLHQMFGEKNTKSGKITPEITTDVVQIELIESHLMATK